MRLAMEISDREKIVVLQAMDAYFMASKATSENFKIEMLTERVTGALQKPLNALDPASVGLSYFFKSLTENGYELKEKSNARR